MTKDEAQRRRWTFYEAVIFGRRNLPTIIGKKSFVDEIKDKFFANKTHEEVPESRFLAPDVDTIINGVCKYYNILALMISFYLVSIHKWPFSAISASICGIICAAYCMYASA